MSILRLKRNGWIIVADGEKALFLKNEGDAINPVLHVFREIEQENPPTHEQGTARPGRLSDGASGHRSAVQETDWHRAAKEDFAHDLADRLYKYAHSGDFKELILVAPPLVLGELRKEMHKEVSSKIIAEVHKTLTKHPVHEIEKIVLGG